MEKDRDLKDRSTEMNQELTDDFAELDQDLTDDFAELNQDPTDDFTELDQDPEDESEPEEDAPTYSFVEKKGEGSKKTGKKKKKKKVDPEKAAAEERARRRAEKREAEKRARRERIGSIIITAGVILILIAVAIFVRSCGKGQNAVESQSTESAQTVQEAGNGSAGEAAGTAAQSAEAGSTAPGAEENVPAADEAGAQEAASDRSSFAVDPGKTDWNYDTESGEKTVYLTFDDGPSYLTPAVLDVLDQYGVKATFFVTGQNPEYYDYIGEAFRRGHTIGLHTYSHDYEQVYASVDAYYQDLGQIGEIVEAQIGFVPCFIRFPGGASNTISAHYSQGIMSILSEDVIARGYQYWDWNNSVADGSTVTVEEVCANAVKVDPNTMVLLLHDGNGKDTTWEALPGVIELLTDMGYNFKALDREAPVVHHSVLN